MKTHNDLLTLISKAILLEAKNNFMVKYNIRFGLNNEILSFDISYADDSIKDTKKINFLFNMQDITDVKLQAYYWQLASHLERFNLTH